MTAVGHAAHGAVAGLRRVGPAAEAASRSTKTCSGEQIRDLRLAGTEVTEEIRRPRVAYLGDSAPAGLDDNPAMYEAEILICELTFVAPDHRKEHIHKFGHMHLDDLVDRRDRFKNELIIAAHLSTRYHPNAVREMVATAAARHARRPADAVAVAEHAHMRMY